MNPFAKKAIAAKPAAPRGKMPAVVKSARFSTVIKKTGGKKRTDVVAAAALK